MRIALSWSDRARAGRPRTFLSAPLLVPILAPLLAPLLALTLSACGNDNLDEPQQLGPLRVLALIASAPEVQPGDSTIIIPFVSDFDQGAERGGTWNFSWVTCPDPGISYGAEPECQTTLLSGTGSITTLNSLNAYTAASNSPITVQAPPASSAFWTSRTAAQQLNGVSLIFQFTLTTGTESIRAFRRIVVTSRSTLNQKPSAITAISPATLPATEGKVSPTFTEAADSYGIQLNDGSTITRTEKLTVSWYTTAGEFKFNRTDGKSENTWTPPSSGSAKVFLFLRDDRGGVSDALQL